MALEIKARCLEFLHSVPSVNHTDFPEMRRKEPHSIRLLGGYNGNKSGNCGPEDVYCNACHRKRLTMATCGNLCKGRPHKTCSDQPWFVTPALRSRSRKSGFCRILLAPHLFIQLSAVLSSLPRSSPGLANRRVGK